MNNGNHSSERPIKILFVDDDPDVRDLVKLICDQAGMMVTCSEDGEEALTLWRKVEFDLVILDIMMPRMDGIEVLHQIRDISEIPVILLSAKGMESDVVLGFDAGADEYIIKPFRKNEFLSRIKAVVSRINKSYYPTTGQMVFGNIILDTSARQVKYQGKSVDVTPQEFQLLRYLMQNQGVVLSKEDLLRNVWGYAHSQSGEHVDLNLIEAAIRRLRKKLEIDPSQPQMIRTIWGAGYRFGV